MALPNVDIQIQNGLLPGVIPTDDALVGLMFQGPAPSDLALLTPTLITTLQEAEALGITAAYDSTNTVTAHRQISEFFAEAGAGARLWIMGVSQAVSMEDMFDVAEANYAVKLLNAAEGKIRVLSVVRNPAGGYTPSTSTNQIDADVIAAAVTAQALAESYAEQYKPLRILLPGYAYTGTHSTLVNLRARTENRVAILLGDTVSGANCATGLALGRLAAIPVQRNMGRVKDGPVQATSIFLGSSAHSAVAATIAGIHDKGFVTFRTFVGKAGYYFTSDPVAAPLTDDYRSISRGRVIDKALVIAYTVFVNEILDEIEIDSAGRIEASKAKYYQSIIESAVAAAMTANNEISRFRATVDVDQDVLTTGQVCIEARITPVGYAEEIIVKLGFENPQNS